VINGNCGLSIAPCPPNRRKEILKYLLPITGSLPEDIVFDSFSEYLTAVSKQKLPLNFGSYVGNGTLRMAANGFDSGELKEYHTIHRYLEDALQAGAFGVSLGLVYVPECFYTLDTLELALAPIRGGNIPIISHVRGEGTLLLESLKEVIAIAERLEVPLHISHLKSLGKANWQNQINDALRLLEDTREQGLQVTWDVYPWEAGSTQMLQLLPPEYLEGGITRTLRRLQGSKERELCRKILETPQTSFENQIYLVGWENIMVSSVQSEANQKYIGKRVTEIAEERNTDPYNCAFDLIVEEGGNVSIVNFIACDEDIITILRHKDSIIISDSIYPDTGIMHPRAYGTFPKILGEFVRERKLLALEEAIHKFTYAPASRFGIKNKGLIKEGMDADITVFDPLKIQNNAGYTNSMVLATGINQVFVGGIPTNNNDNFKNTGAGKVIRR